MVGDSARFKKEGFHMPKWTIRIGGKTMLQYAVESILPMRIPGEKFILISLLKDKPFVLKLLHEMPIFDFELVFLDSPTSGQAATVREGLLKSKTVSGERLVIWCCDSYILPDTLSNHKEYGNHLFLAKLNGFQWSFARTDGDLVIETSEKVRISDLASIGLYVFSDAKDYLNLKFIAQRNLPEVYIAPLFNQLIQNKSSVKFTEISSLKYLTFGTPKEMLISAAELGLKVNL
jgi:dTDP-glucose pyrophosphorylase